MNKLIKQYKRCKKSDTIFIKFLIRYVYHRIVHKKSLHLHQKVQIKGFRNIEIKGKVDIGVDYVGFAHKNDNTLLNIGGKLRIGDECLIQRGCRFDIGKNAIVTFGDGVAINCNTRFVIMNGLSLGNNVDISWDCSFLDENFHHISYPGRKERGKAITIGNNVWIGNGVKICQGTVIPDGCVISSHSVVKGVFTEEKTLIGGHPARVLKSNVDWN